MAHSYRGADVVAQALTRAGVKRIFTLSGNHIMPLFDALLDARIELFHTRHEAAAVHMADAWGRLTGEAGIALVSGGPAHGNAISALYTAQMSDSPVVLLSGHAPTDQLGFGSFQEMHQAEMATPVTKGAWTSTGVDTLGNDIARAISTACSGRPGPVQLSLPVDALNAKGREETIPATDAFLPQAMPLDATEAGTLLDRLQAAARPLILTGSVCLTKAGRAQAQSLEEALGIPVVGMESPRGTNDPSLGAFAEMLAKADCILLVGKRMDFTLGFGKTPTFAADCQFLQIDADRPELDRAKRSLGDRLVASIAADAISAITALTTAVGKRQRRHDAWCAEVQTAIQYRPAAWTSATSTEPGRLHPVQVCKPLQAILDSHPDSVMVSDGGEFGQWAQACLTAPNRMINGPAAAIGSSLPLALAARVAKPDAPVIALMGDGTFGFHLAEIDTAVRYRLPFISVIGNDARWNAEYQIQLKSYGQDRLIGCELLPTRYDQVSIAFGGHGEHVDTPDALLPAAKRAHQSGLPACLNVAMEGVPAPVVKR
ncbi:MAG TPA: thiamine pyrophosphate-binding protein [Gemmatimonadaceae bacterium]|nr:thiamine pyrophosphate-binding protein [Gemmatimonadaceae bacterium]